YPIDVWIERVLREKYFARKRRVTGQILADFAANYFGAHGGYAQQYLFHHARMTGKRRGNRQADSPARDTSHPTDIAPASRHAARSSAPPTTTTRPPAPAPQRIPRRPPQPDTHSHRALP